MNNKDNKKFMKKVINSLLAFGMCANLNIKTLKMRNPKFQKIYNQLSH